MKSVSEQSFYEILEIPRTATPEEIQRAYERARSLFSPGSLVSYTLLPPDEAEALSRRIEEARSVLLDPEARASYDQRLPADGERHPKPGAPATPARTPGPPPLPGKGARPSEEPAAPPAPVAATAASTAPAAPAGVEFQAPEGGAWTGALLRKAREARGLTILQVADRTKLTRHHIENVEEERFDKLPVAVYLRGVLLQVAKELRLDGEAVCRSYLERAAAAKPPPRGR